MYHICIYVCISYIHIYIYTHIIYTYMYNINIVECRASTLGIVIVIWGSIPIRVPRTFGVCKQHVFALWFHDVHKGLKTASSYLEFCIDIHDSKHDTESERHRTKS